MAWDRHAETDHQRRVKEAERWVELLKIFEMGEYCAGRRLGLVPVDRRRGEQGRSDTESAHLTDAWIHRRRDRDGAIIRLARNERSYRSTPDVHERECTIVQGIADQHGGMTEHDDHSIESPITERADRTVARHICRCAQRIAAPAERLLDLLPRGAYTGASRADIDAPPPG